MVLDLLKPLGARVVIKRIEGDDGIGQIVEQRLRRSWNRGSQCSMP
jgi:hypothetical protein